MTTSKAKRKAKGDGVSFTTTNSEVSVSALITDPVLRFTTSIDGGPRKDVLAPAERDEHVATLKNRRDLLKVVRDYLRYDDIRIEVLIADEPANPRCVR